MKLIKTISLAIVLFAFSNTSKAQVYVNAGIGYGAPALRDLVAVDYTNTSGSTMYKGVYSSYGTGVLPHVVIGYKINPNVGMEFGYGYLLGGKIKTNIHDEQGVNTETGTMESWARMHQFLIGGRVTASEGDLQPYLRVGAIFGVGGQLFDEVNTTTTGPTVNMTYHRITEFNEGVAFGFNGGLGIHYHASDMFGFFVEANMIAQNWAPKHSEITTLHVDGQDQLGGMTIRDKETEYVKEYTFTPPPNDGQPDQDLKFFLPMSSIGVAAGVHIYFGE